MKLAPAHQLFFGFKIDSKMREALASASVGDKQFFAEGSPYLRIMSKDAEHWIGKVVDSPIPPTELEDIQRNVLSILNRVAAGVRHSLSNMRIFVIVDGDSTPFQLIRPRPGDDADIG